MKKAKRDNILAVDRWKKYIGLAYYNHRSQMTMPLGTLMNDQSLMFNMWWVIERYFIGTVVVGRPKQHKEHQQHITALLEKLLFVEPNLRIVKWDEEYSSVQAAEKLGAVGKVPWEDSIAAMVILENSLPMLLPA